MASSVPADAPAASVPVLYDPATVPAEATTVPAGAPGLFSKAFLKYAGERAIKTLVQVVIAVLGASQATGKVGFVPAIITVGVSVLASVSTSVVAAVGTDQGAASE